MSHNLIQTLIRVIGANQVDRISWAWTFLVDKKGPKYLIVSSCRYRIRFHLRERKTRNAKKSQNKLKKVSGAEIEIEYFIDCLSHRRTNTNQKSSSLTRFQMTVTKRRQLKGPLERRWWRPFQMSAANESSFHLDPQHLWASPFVTFIASLKQCHESYAVQQCYSQVLVNFWQSD